jgi:hypothetical protein
MPVQINGSHHASAYYFPDKPLLRFSLAALHGSPKHDYSRQLMLYNVHTYARFSTIFDDYHHY